jgi:predicted nuclease of restriction endonuclease-like (RecB) superfamily
MLRLDDPWKRAFYENECLKGGWSIRQLQRLIEHDRDVWEQQHPEAKG